MKHKKIYKHLEAGAPVGIVETSKRKAKRTKKRLGESPSISKRVHVKGSTFMVPKIELKTPEALEAWRAEMVQKYGL